MVATDSTAPLTARSGTLQTYNAAVDLIERNLAVRPEKIAYIDDYGAYTYAELARRVNRCANALTGLGMALEARVLLCLTDTVDFPSVFLGAIKAGIVPVAVNTSLTSSEYDFMLRDSRSQALIVSEPLLPAFKPIFDAQPFLKHIVVSGGSTSGYPQLGDLIAAAGSDFTAAPTRSDEPCFWLYSSGSTGTPKGTVHVQTSPIQTAELYAQPIVGIQESDVVFSAAKLFFAYGLGNALTFPLSVGATTVLLSERPIPAAVCRVLRQHRPTSAALYWNNREKSRSTFLGPWTKSGDKYIESEDGYFIYCGRADDMLKVSGMWVSPFEVEAALASHEAVLEAAVVGHADENGLIKPKAFIVLRPDVQQAPELAATLQQHVKDRLAPYKYPRWVEFVPELPKTATGKIQRFKLRAVTGA